LVTAQWIIRVGFFYGPRFVAFTSSLPGGQLNFGVIVWRRLTAKVDKVIFSAKLLKFTHSPDFAKF
jgi:hypothetical protein